MSALPATPLLQAVSDLAAHQSYPAGALYMVATPIGNLADISLRAIQVLALCDAVACEDTRNTGTLLKAYGLHKPLLAVHEHNEREAAKGVLERLTRGERLAYVSDAGTPALSDPGAKLAASARAQKLRVIPIPGASSVTTLLSAAGIEYGLGRFTFVGFLPAKGAARKAAWDGLVACVDALVILESPHRIVTLCAELTQYVPARQVTIGRELTKQFEQIVTLSGSECPAWLAAKAEHAKGEFALVIHPPEQTPAQTGAMQVLQIKPEVLLGRLIQELPLKSAVAVAVDVTGLPKNQLYEMGLQIKEAQQ